MDHFEKEKTHTRYQKGSYMKTEKEMVLPQSPCEWSEHISKSGRKYYFNIRTEISQWEKPQILTEKESVLKARAKMLVTIRKLENNNVHLKNLPSYHNKTDVTPSLQSTTLAEMINIPLAVDDNVIDSPNSMVTINLQKALHNLHQAIIYSQKSKCTATKKNSHPASTKSSISPLESLSSSSPNDFDSIGDPEETFDLQEESNSSNIQESHKKIGNSSSPSTNQIFCIKPNQENHLKKLSTFNGDNSKLNQVTDEICYAGKDIKLHLCQINVNCNGIPIYEIVNATPSDAFQVLSRYHQKAIASGDLKFTHSTNMLYNNAPTDNHKRLAYYVYSSPALPGWNNPVNSLQLTNIYSKSLYAKNPALTESENIFCKKLLNYFESPIDINFPIHLTYDSDNDDVSLSNDYTPPTNILSVDEQESFLQKESIELETKANSFFYENINTFYTNYVKSDIEFNTFLMDCELNEAMVMMLDSRLDAIQKQTCNFNDFKSEHFSAS